MAEGGGLTVELVTPERILFSGVATEVVLRTREGDITFLADHAPLVGAVEPGVVRVDRFEGDVVKVASHGGFVQVEYKVPLGTPDDAAAGAVGGAPATGTRVTLLMGVAELADEIDAGRARTALEASEARLSELSGTGRGAGESEEDDEELAEATAALRRAEVRLEATEQTATPGPAGG